MRKWLKRALFLTVRRFMVWLFPQFGDAVATYHHVTLLENRIKANELRIKTLEEYQDDAYRRRFHLERSLYQPSKQ